MRFILATVLLAISIGSVYAKSPQLQLNEQEYFSMPGLDVTVFADIYPDGHQSGVTVIQHGRRVAANGDLRLEPSPGQWSPVPRSNVHKVDADTQRITQILTYPDPTKNRKGFNPIDYPDLRFSYKVNVEPAGGSSFTISVDLDKPLPSKWVGRVGFNFELLPSEYFGLSYRIGDQFGVFPRQPNGPMTKDQDEYIAFPFGTGPVLTVAAESPQKRMTIKSHTGHLSLIDGRANHNNGWFIVRSLIPKGATSNAIRWTVTPNADPDWRYPPVIQVSQVGYRPKHPKKIVVEQDARDTTNSPLTIFEITPEGKKPVFKGSPKPWGKFLRYQYATLDFSYLDKPGIYVAEYRGLFSTTFKIDDNVFARGVWQPTLEYFLPVQMCHMRVEQKYRVWHDLCHNDDALMSPANNYHLDGYSSGPINLTTFDSGARVPLLNHGGWHDAGDYDLRVESQANTLWLLAAMVEEFQLNMDSTTIDQSKRLVQIHQPDGVSDALQQIEHGLISVLGGYTAMGRLYRGIISPTTKQYVLLGDASAQTDGLAYKADLEPDQTEDGFSGNPDDRWVFTEDNPDRALNTAAALSAAARVIKTHNAKMAKLAQQAAEELYSANFSKANMSSAKAFVLVELYKSTLNHQYLETLVAMKTSLLEHIGETGWHLARIRSEFKDPKFNDELNNAVATLQSQIRQQAQETPYGVPYKPSIWGAGWTIQEFGVRQYFYHKGWPEFATPDIYLSALNFILGVHPGENRSSFASGVGTESALVAYGINRADWSYIPGGVISGTALIRPDLPELKEWPYFWQQTEYVVGGGATNFMFLVLAAQKLE